MGDCVGLIGEAVGSADGTAVGFTEVDGMSLGEKDGFVDGNSLGDDDTEGSLVGDVDSVGCEEGAKLGHSS